MSHLAGVPDLARLEIGPRGPWILEFRYEEATVNDRGVGEQTRRTLSAGIQRAGGRLCSRPGAWQTGRPAEMRSLAARRGAAQASRVPSGFVWGWELCNWVNTR